MFEMNINLNGYKLTNTKVISSGHKIILINIDGCDIFIMGSLCNLVDFDSVSDVWCYIDLLLVRAVGQ